MLLEALLLYYTVLIKRQQSEELFVYVLFVLLHMSVAPSFAQLLQVKQPGRSVLHLKEVPPSLPPFLPFR